MTLTPTDHSWRKWIDHLRLKGEHQLADQAERSGSITVPRKWPEADTPLPVVEGARA